MLHRHQGPTANDGGAGGNLHGNLFVRGPFRIDIALVLFRHSLGNFGAGRAGIGGSYRTARFPGSPGYGLVSLHQLLHR